MMPAPAPGVRLGVRAIVLREGRVLLVNAYPGDESDLWCPPGGGAERGQSLADNLRREVTEETGLRIEPGRLIAVSEFHDPDSGFHQVDLIYAAALAPGVQTAAVLRDPAGVVNRLRWVDAAGLARIRFKPDCVARLAFGPDPGAEVIYDPLERQVR